MKTFRRRSKSVQCFMTEAEVALFNNAYMKTNCRSRADFILSLLEDKPIIVIDELHPALVELKRQGNNLNQIARALNQGDTVNRTLDDTLKGCWAAYEKLCEIGDDINAAYGSTVKPRKTGEGD